VAHKFAVGQTVDVVRKVLRPAAPGSYEILVLVPAPDSDPQDPCYRIKNTDEKYERIIPESELTLSPRTGSYREMCDAENVQTLQRGMNFRMKPSYSVILMSQRTNAPYRDRVCDDGVTIEYEGHDVPRRSYDHNPKSEDQADRSPNGRPTQNGLFIRAVDEHKEKGSPPELIKVYEKITPGVWSLKGYFDLIDYKHVHDGKRNVFRYILRLSDRVGIHVKVEPSTHARLIPSEVKKEVWKRDSGRCVICGESKNLHFDHDLPFSKGGTSISAKKVRLLCMKHNLQKSAKIE
jgi:hypothetical protein